MKNPWRITRIIEWRPKVEKTIFWSSIVKIYNHFILIRDWGIVIWNHEIIGPRQSVYGYLFKIRCKSWHTRQIGRKNDSIIVICDLSISYIFFGLAFWWKKKIFVSSKNVYTRTRMERSSTENINYYLLSYQKSFGQIMLHLHVRS